jgi:hypothetical protein
VWDRLINAPIVSTGVSTGGGFASRLATNFPEQYKMLAVVPCFTRLAVDSLNHPQVNSTLFDMPILTRTNVGLMIGGKDIVFRKNNVSGGNITGGQGWGCLLADCVGPGYERYVGNIKIADNTFNCQADGNNCVHLVAPDTSFTGNNLNVKGSALGIRGEDPLPQSLTIKNNTLSMGTGTGIYIASPRVDGSTVTGNRITGSGAHGIYMASPPKPNAGKHVIYGNTVTGYRTALFIDLAPHPGTVLTGKE